MNKYIYRDLEKDGYERFYLNKKEHNKLFPNYKINLLNKYEFYYSPDYIIVRNFVSIFGVVLATISYPFVMLFYGLRDYKHINKQLYELYNQKKSGYFEEYYYIRNIMNQSTLNYIEEKLGYRKD